MKESLQVGIRHELQYVVPKSKIVSALYPESQEFQIMPEVFATGYMIGLIEWACIQAVNPHIDWPSEQTVGTHVNVSHLAQTPPGLKVRVNVELIGINGRQLTFKVEARDNFDVISTGTHQRFIVCADKFKAKGLEKFQRAESLE